MAKRKKPVSEGKRPLSASEFRDAVRRIMAAAQAHWLASNHCTNYPDPKPSTENFFLLSVSFELLLLSIEHSLRLLILLHHSIFLGDIGHNSHVLYKELRKRSGGKEGLRSDIINAMNLIAQGNGLDPISERELKSCLEKHDSSYSTFRYFQLNRQGKLNEGVMGFAPRERDILLCLAEVLIAMNEKAMRSRGFDDSLIVSHIPLSKELAEQYEEWLRQAR